VAILFATVGIFDLGLTSILSLWCVVDVMLVLRLNLSRLYLTGLTAAAWMVLVRCSRSLEAAVKAHAAWMVDTEWIWHIFVDVRLSLTLRRSDCLARNLRFGLSRCFFCGMKMVEIVQAAMDLRVEDLEMADTVILRFVAGFNEHPLAGQAMTVLFDREGEHLPAGELPRGFVSRSVFDRSLKWIGEAEKRRSERLTWKSKDKKSGGLKQGRLF
jgi:hypothetical protein